MKLPTCAVPLFLCFTLSTVASGFVVVTRDHSSGTRTCLAESPRKTEKGQRYPWDVFRFVSQSSKFVPTPFQSKAARRVVRPGEALWRPDAFSNDFKFAPLDDVVMGGASQSQFDNVSGIWKGRVTDANNGGFIGIRNFPYFEWDMTDCRGLEFTLRSKNKPGRYKIGLRDNTEFNGIVWNASIDVGTNPTKVRVPLENLKPTRFARTVGNEVLQKNTIVGLQLIYSKFEYDGALNPKFEIGDVDLQVMEIKAY